MLPGSTVLPPGSTVMSTVLLGRSTVGPWSTGGPVLPGGSTGIEHEHRAPYVNGDLGARGNIQLSMYNMYNMYMHM